MNKQQDFSPRLFYSVEPQDLSSLHLLDANVNDVFNWTEEKHYTLGQKLLNYFKADTSRQVKHY
jgi:hypothetical protein